MTKPCIADNVISTLSLICGKEIWMPLFLTHVKEVACLGLRHPTGKQLLLRPSSGDNETSLGLLFLSFLALPTFTLGCPPFIPSPCSARILLL